METYTWSYLKKYPKQTKRLLGIDDNQLEQLIALGKLLHQKKKKRTKKQKLELINLVREVHLY
ncbi:hypothetical protein cce_1099 [Crocosphaera subtropica ATCC 51142]|uniref:Uncharacterized protein n=1 Tax=Crocosphaera subtropica (strain ATCC 51142 / BH68) TaxID=43989 RepID=B1WTY3_CROS5|nr:hypothetical protein [Crocosphaera subtropica]ACB50449.1 hypothetical protein cce_1099 [Crocosphaera subtropica ATCC 51142]